jgi:endonuclease/exonuclease/phosphatase family metal-dependent hydrolase
MLKYLLLISISLSAYALDKDMPPEGVKYSEELPTNYKELCSWGKIASYKLASHLTDPPCKVREYLVRSQILQDLPPSTYMTSCAESFCSFGRKSKFINEQFLNPHHIAHFAERYFLYGGIAVFSILSPITTLSGMLLRFAASNLEKERFIHYRTSLPPKNLKNDSFTHMHWNICGINAGFDIETGGQMPIQDDLLPLSENRLYKIGEKILKENPDVICLNEVFDIKDALYLVKTLQDKYSHFVFQCGAKMLGLNSGLFFATRFSIKDIHFTAFPSSFSIGAVRYIEKGYLSLKAYDENGPIARMILSHLQGSDESDHPKSEEQLIRKKQIAMILQDVDFHSNENVIVAGDLNLDDEEFLEVNPEFYSQFNKTVDYTSPDNEEPRTWLGDHWRTEFRNRENSFSLLPSNISNPQNQVSEGINLDHVLVKKQADESLSPKITTTLKSTGYDPKKISRDSLSDHMILLSHITLKR